MRIPYKKYYSGVYAKSQVLFSAQKLNFDNVEPYAPLPRLARAGGVAEKKNFSAAENVNLIHTFLWRVPLAALARLLKTHAGRGV